MFAITGATGNTGSRIAARLLKAGERVRAIGRSEDKLKTLKDQGAEIAVGDQIDVSFLTKAFSGAQAVYLLLPPKSDSPDLGRIKQSSSIQPQRRFPTRKYANLSFYRVWGRNSVRVLGPFWVCTKLKSVSRQLRDSTRYFFARPISWKIP